MMPDQYVDLTIIHVPTLIASLRDAHVQLNEHANELLQLLRQAPEPHRGHLLVREYSVGELRLQQPATLPAIYEQAANIGLQPCPLLVGPVLRLAYQDQPDTPETSPQHRAPEGSLTVASPMRTRGTDQPQGFYLRKIAGQLWLRGYVCSADFVWQDDDRLAFVVPQ